MTLTRVLAFNTLAQYLGKFLSLLASVVVTSILTKKLGVEGYGQYVYVFSIIMLFTSFADWGSTFVATREASKQPQKQDLIYSTSLIFRLLASLIAVATLSLLTFFYPSFVAVRSIILIGCLLIPLISLKTSFQIVYQTKLQLWRLSIIDTFSSLSFMLFLLLTPQSFFTPFNVLLLLCISAFLSVVLGIILLLQLTKLPIKLDLKLGVGLLRSSLSMGLLLTIFSVYNRIDILILEHLKGNDSVAYYGLSYKIYENLIIGAGFFANTTFPILAARAYSRNKFRRIFEKNLAGLLLIGIFATLFGFLLSQPIIQFLAGNEFSSSIPALRILSLSLLIVYLNHATGFALIALNKQHFSALAALAALCFNAIANYLLIPHFSFMASAVITGLTELIMFIITLTILLRHLKRVSIKRILSYLHPRTILGLMLR